MKTTCHCVYCPKHPKHAQRGEIDVPRGFVVGNWLFDEASAAEVDCLRPLSDAFFEFSIEPSLEDFPVTAYGDGCSQTGFHRDGATIYATCRNEEYEG